MASSLVKLKQQIEKLQKQADAVQATVVGRIRREIDQHGLTVEQLFGSSSAASAGGGRKVQSKKSGAVGAGKPDKYADDQGNGWHGVGKRPQWLKDALEGGRSLDDFLVGANRTAPAARRAAAWKKMAPKTNGKAVVAKKTANTAKAAKPAGKAPVAKNAKAISVKKAARATPAKKTGAKAVEAANSSTA
ncbi:H-NS family nucleoid-associated regulatory protein [Roseateles sp. LYH14W]|uniref:H-NS family nucleoid-associated regulatory protein n=1 Tax=Pelomonas parva TaxID=3299032 RepID=A0ABW7F7Y9_9BURK